MWQNLICASVISLGLIGVAGGVAAQQPLADRLAALSIFDCTDGETRTIHVFESTPDGAVTLLTSQAAAPSIGNDGFAPAAANASERVFVFRDGSTTKGICTSITDVARAAYPVITAGLLPDIDEGSSAEGVATSLTIRDLKGRVQAATDDNLALQADLVDLRDALNQKTQALSAQTVALQTMRDELASTLAKLDMTEQERRKLMANAAVLNQSISSLNQSLRAANESTEEAEAETKAMGRLADAAIAWISTLQVRNGGAVRAEICGTIAPEDRPAVCR